jgi:phosphoenolpyruvate-protein kinase (PTS system EI component)
LLWDAAGLVTATGSPSAHLYESARALGIPAVSGVEVPVGDRIVAIDGNTGLVASLALNGDEDV